MRVLLVENEAKLAARVCALMRRPGARSGSPMIAGNIAFDATTMQENVEGEPLLLPRPWHRAL